MQGQRALIITRLPKGWGLTGWAGNLRENCRNTPAASRPGSQPRSRFTVTQLQFIVPIAPRTIMLDRAFFGHIFGNRIVWMNVIRTIWVDQTISVDLIILER